MSLGRGLSVAFAAVALLATSCRGGDENPALDVPSSTTAPAVTTLSVPGTASSSVVPTTSGEESALTTTSRVRLDGVGPIRVGMTLDEASAKIGQPLRYETVPEHGDCGFADVPVVRRGRLVIDGRIRRVDAGEKSTIVTVSGVGRGSTEAEVMRAYGGRGRL